MATATTTTATTALSPAKSANALRSAASILPGILLLAAIGYAGKFLERFLNTYAKAHHWTFPNIEYVLWAILIGLVVANTVGVPKLFQAGIDTYEFWLKLGIVFLGARFVLADMLKLGGISLALVVIEITLSLALMTLLGRAFKLTSSPSVTKTGQASVFCPPGGRPRYKEPVSTTRPSPDARKKKSYARPAFTVYRLDPVEAGKLSQALSSGSGMECVKLITQMLAQQIANRRHNANLATDSGKHPG